MITDAKATILHSIVTGLIEHAHITKASYEHAEMQSNDIFNALFHPSVRWAIEEYMKES